MFQSLGSAYCPVTEMSKQCVLKEVLGTETLKVGDAKFFIPTYMKYYEDSTTHFLCPTCNTKEDYERDKMKQYEFEEDMKLIVAVNSNGRWIATISNSDEYKISVIYEIRVCSLQIGNPNAHIDPELLTAIDSLPRTYDKEYKENSDAFQQFFRMYGTHFVCRQALGGYMKFSFFIDKDICSVEKKGAVEAEVEGLLDDLIAGRELIGETVWMKMQNAGIFGEQLTLRGGKPPLISSLV